MTRIESSLEVPILTVKKSRMSNKKKTKRNFFIYECQNVDFFQADTGNKGC